MTASTQPPELSVVVLCYRSEDFARTFAEQLIAELDASAAATWELLLVANYDDENDPTPSIADAFAADHPNVRVIARRKQGRMGWDMRSGLEAATGRYIAVIDGDGQMPVSDIPVVFDIIRTGHFDLVKTYRARRADGFWRRLLSAGYNRLFALLFRPRFAVNDINSKPKIMRREAYERMDLHSDDWFTDSEIMIRADALNLRICEVATSFGPNERRASLVGLTTVMEFIWNLVRYRFQ